MTPGKAYKGVLAEPMKLDPDNAAAELGYYLDRLLALKEHYEVPDLSDGSLMILVLKLAQDHVPGFQWEQLPKRTGPKLGNPYRDFIIFTELSRAKFEGKTISVRANYLAQSGRVKGLTGKSIRQRYYTLKEKGTAGRQLVQYLSFIREKSEKAE